MNWKRFLTLLILAFSFFAMVKAQEHQGSKADTTKQEFGKKEFEAFHTVLRPLQHKALPAGDFKKIREKSDILAAKGEEIVKLGLPKELKDSTVYAKTLAEFAKALGGLKHEAKEGTDAELKKSYIAVHNLYEELMNLLPD